MGLKENGNSDAPPVYTASNGCPVMDPQQAQRVGTEGPLLLQDFHLIDLLAHFDRERIPERWAPLSSPPLLFVSLSLHPILSRLSLSSSLPSCLYSPPLT